MIKTMHIELYYSEGGGYERTSCTMEASKRLQLT